jgi:hypothetical protein
VAIGQTVVSFEPVHCWDCPVPLLRCLFLQVVAVAALSAGQRLAPARGARRSLGAALLTVSVLLYWIVTVYVLKHGVIWNSGWHHGSLDFRQWRLSRWSDLALLVTWFALSVIVARACRPDRPHPKPRDAP